MKIGVAYNLFDGEELLEYSINSVRPFVDFICIVYQTTSNFGNKNEEIENLVFKLERDNKVDFIYKYTPEIKKDYKNNVSWQNGQINEYSKRNLGLKICRANECDIFMSMDSDELYDEIQFNSALKEFIDFEYDSSFCKMRTFYKFPDLQLFPLEEYYVPVFYRINKDSEFDRKYSKDYVVMCDPTRRLKSGYSKIYSREELEMFHYSYVRNNLSSKVLNSSAQMDIHSQNQVLNHFENFSNERDGAFLIGMQQFSLRKVKNKFNIEL